MNIEKVEGGKWWPWVIVNTMKKTMIGILVPLLSVGLLAGCGANNARPSKSNATSVTKISKSSSKATKKADDEKSGSKTTNAKNGGSNTTSNQSVNGPQSNNARTSKATASGDTAVGQVTQTSILNAVANQMRYQYSRQDLLMSITSANGIFTVQVQENHQSANMKRLGADPNVNPTVAWFQSNANGQLLRSDNGGASYYVVGNAY